MKSKEVLFSQKIDGSKFQLVIAAAKRSKQLNRMSKDRGLPPNQVAYIRTDLIKPSTIALKEILDGKINYSYKQKKTDEEIKDENIEAEGENNTDENNKEVPDAVASK